MHNFWALAQTKEHNQLNLCYFNYIQAIQAVPFFSYMNVTAWNNPRDFPAFRYSRLTGFNINQDP